MLDLLKSKKFLGIIAGGIGGFLWYAIIGCSTGGCPITSNPWISSGYGAVLGFLWSIPGRDEEKKKAATRQNIKG